MEKKYYDIIWDEDEVGRFYDTVLARKPLLRNEVRFVSLSARNKYLTDEERKYYHFGRSEMFGKQVVRHDSKDAYLQAIRRYECNVEGYLTENGLPFPQHAMVCYVNINPSDVLKTLNEMNSAIDEHKDALIYAALKNSSDGVLAAFHKLRKVEDTMVSLYAKCVGTRTWIDFDFDVAKDHCPKMFAFVEEFIRRIGGLDHVWIDTKGGMHLLLYKSDLKFDPALLCSTGYIFFWHVTREDQSEIFDPDDANDLKDLDVISQSVELKRNDNALVPCPGTYQAGHRVEMLTSSVIRPSLTDADLATVDVAVKLFKAKKIVARSKKGSKDEHKDKED